MPRKAKKPKRQHTRRPLLPCPGCGHRFTEVAKVIPVADVIRRQRRCLGCGERFITTESTKIKDTGIPLATGIQQVLESMKRTPHFTKPNLKLSTGDQNADVRSEQPESRSRR